MITKLGDVLTTVMSLGLRVLRLLIADWRAGIASARSFSQSSLEMFDVVFVVAMVVRIARSFATTRRMKTRSRRRMCRRQHHIENVDGTNGSDKADVNRYMIYNVDGDLIA